MKNKEKIIKVALKEIGYTESPKNSNMTKYGEWYDFESKRAVKANGSKWCAVFVSWVYHKAEIKFPKILESDKGFIWCPTLTIRARQNGWVTTKPEEGDIVLFDWNGDGGADHVGLFVRWVQVGKTFESIEGNTSPSSQSNGGAVMKRSRSIEQVQHFVQVL
jgi:hypothetical protein